MEGKAERRVAMKDLYFLLSLNLKFRENAQSFGESDIKSRLRLKELHLKYLCAPCYFLLCNDVLTMYGIYLLFFNDPHHQQYLLCVKVLGLKCRFFLMLLKFCFIY